MLAAPQARELGRWLIIVSYVFYAPVVFGAPLYPLLGMLMLPKTVVYLIMAGLCYRAFFARARSLA